MNICKECKWAEDNTYHGLPWKCHAHPVIYQEAHIHPVYGHVPQLARTERCLDKNPEGNCQDYEPKEDQA